ncbi:hypothetical protein HY994_06160 [Candidatus Micrarchaeota archaeon]|nr:hypothetical protein [Candidatus Micrarchaeota archaeon]
MNGPTIRLNALGFEFEVPNRKLTLPITVARQAQKQAEIAAESFFGNRLRRQGVRFKDHPWALTLFHHTNPVSGLIQDSDTLNLVSEARKEPGFIAKWDKLDSDFASTLSLQGLKLCMKRNYPGFLKQNRLTDSPAAVNAYALLVLRQHSLGAERYLRERVEPVSTQLNHAEFSSYDDPAHQFAYFTGQGAYLNLPTISMSKHAGFDNPLMKFIDDHSDILVLGGFEKGRQFYRALGDLRYREKFESILRLHEAMDSLDSRP